MFQCLLNAFHVTVNGDALVIAKQTVPSDGVLFVVNICLYNSVARFIHPPAEWQVITRSSAVSNQPLPNELMAWMEPPRVPFFRLVFQPSSFSFFIFFVTCAETCVEHRQKTELHQYANTPSLNNSLWQKNNNKKKKKKKKKKDKQSQNKRFNWTRLGDFAPHDTGICTSSHDNEKRRCHFHTNEKSSADTAGTTTITKQNQKKK